MTLEYKKNPRKISGEELDDLKVWLERYGDLSGIVLNKTTNQIIAGNQRCKAINFSECEIVYTNKYQEPTMTGTIAEGYVIWNGEKYNYRETMWTELEESRACIIANKAGGSWDFDLLKVNFEYEELLNCGFRFDELDFGSDDIEHTSEVKEQEVIARNIGEHHDYVVFIFENEVDYLRILDHFKVKKAVYKYSDAVQKKGVGRILSGQKLLEVISEKGNN